MESPWDEGTKVYINGPDDSDGRYALMGKKPLKSSSPEPKSYDLVTWHTTSRTQALQSLYK